MPDSNQMPIRKILVIRMSAIGDVVLTLPVIDALEDAFPEAEIHYLIKKEFAELVEGRRTPGEVIPFDRRDGLPGLLELVRLVRGERYDLLVDLHANLRSTAVRMLGGAWMKRAYRKRSLERMLLKNLRLNLLSGAPPVMDRYFTALEDFGLSRDGRRPALELSDAHRETAARAIEGLPSGGLICLAPGAAHATKRWPEERFFEAAAALAGEGDAVALLGGGSERAVTARVAGMLSGRGIAHVDLAGRLAIMESAAVIERSSVLLTNDSGLMHLADALSKPLAAIFGPTTKELGFTPAGPLAMVVERAGLECRPCSLHGDEQCPKGHHECMKEVSANEVVAAAREVMEKYEAARAS